MIDRQRVSEFVTWWRQYCTGDEKGEAQIFLDRLFQGFGHAGALEAGGVFEERIQRLREGRVSVAFADYVIPNRVIIEMKKRGEDLRRHYDQALNYWIDLTTARPRYVVLCNFDEFWIYDLNRQPRDPMDKVKVEDLVDRITAFAFLFVQPATPIFNNDRVAVTEEAAATLSTVFQSLLKPIASRKLEREQAQRFILQCMLALFAEDIGLLPDDLFTRLIEDCQSRSENTYDIMTGLFHAMNRPGRERVGRYRDVDYFDGGLFSEIIPVDTTSEELILLREAARHDWSKIHPGIFGTIFEQSMSQKERHRVGGHFTSEVDILRIVHPVIIRPWRDRISAAGSLEELSALHDALCRYQVLDPACGSGNFLYVAYRAMKGLEHEIIARLLALGGSEPAQFVTSKQLWGFDIKPFAVELAKVALMIAKKLAVDEFGLHEHPLPLDNLDANIRASDALFEPWPAFDACIGNPPYLGAKRLKVEQGVEYVNRVRAAFPEVPGNADYCVYWFRKAHDLMKQGALSGLVGTNTIRQNYSRIGGLDYIVAHDGHIFEAVSSMPWSGEAAVSVSIACWSKGEPPYQPARLWLNDGDQATDIPSINSSLSIKSDVSSAMPLKVNFTPKRVYQGQIPGHEAFVLLPDEAREMARRDPSSRKILFPFLIGRDLIAQSQSKPSRYVIDMNAYDVLEAQQFREAFRRIREQVLPLREQKAKAEIERNRQSIGADSEAKVNRHHQMFLSQWWKHSYGRPDMIAEIHKRSRYIVCSEVTKRSIFEFVSPLIRPDHALQAFMFADDYSFGVLQSRIHWEWLTEKGSTLTDRFRYTPHSVFDTFPWPQSPTPNQVKAVAQAAQELHEYRRQIMAKRQDLTLRVMYRSLELPGKNRLKELHMALDEAVMAAYGFDPGGDLLAQLLELNHTVAAHIEAGELVTGPGIPPNYPDPTELVSTGCITPSELI